MDQFMRREPTQYDRAYYADIVRCSLASIYKRGFIDSINYLHERYHFDISTLIDNILDSILSQCSKCKISRTVQLYDAVYPYHRTHIGILISFTSHENCDRCLLNISALFNMNDLPGYIHLTNEMDIMRDCIVGGTNYTSHIKPDTLKQMIISCPSLCTMRISPCLYTLLENSTNIDFRDAFRLGRNFNLIDCYPREMYIVSMYKLNRLYQFDLQSIVITQYSMYFSGIDTMNIKRIANKSRTSYLNTVKLMLGVVRRIRYPSLATPLMDHIASYVLMPIE